MKLIRSNSTIARCSINYFEHPITSEYFKLREYLQYNSSAYPAWQSVEQGRNFYPKLIREILRFIRKTSNPDARQILDEYIFKILSKTDYSHQEKDSLVETFKSVNLRGYHLLGIVEPINYEELKFLYREAAKKHHPDLGGCNEDMQTVNEAFTTFCEILRFYEIEGDNPSTSIDIENPKSTSEFISYVANKLLVIYEDIWALDKAYQWFKTIENNGWNLSYYPISMGRFSKRLYAADMIPEATEIFGYAYESYEEAKTRGIDYGKYINSAKSILDGKSKLRVVINHPYQAKHAFRLNIINEEKYKNLMKEFRDNALEDIKDAEVLRNYATARGFIKNLPCESSTLNKNIVNSLVPSPAFVNGHHSYFEELTEKQKAEYARAFSHKTNLSLIKKYVFVRMNSYLKGLIYHYNEVDIAKILDECDLFMKLISDNRTRFSFHCTSLVTFINAINNLPELERTERLNLLRHIHELSVAQRYQQGLNINIDLIIDEQGEFKIETDIDSEGYFSSYNCIIGPISSYTEDALLPVEILEKRLDKLRKSNQEPARTNYSVGSTKFKD